MNKHLTPSEIRLLPVSDRLRLIEDVWNSLAEAPETVEVPNWHRAELDARLSNLDSDRDAAKSWDDVKEDVLGALRK